MSLDVCLKGKNGETLYSRNITHNLGRMAQAAGIYECLWRPEEHGITHAQHRSSRHWRPAFSYWRRRRHDSRHSTRQTAGGCGNTSCHFAWTTFRLVATILMRL